MSARRSKRRAASGSTPANSQRTGHGERRIIQPRDRHSAAEFTTIAESTAPRSPCDSTMTQQTGMVARAISTLTTVNARVRPSPAATASRTTLSIRGTMSSARIQSTAARSGLSKMLCESPEAFTAMTIATTAVAPAMQATALDMASRRLASSSAPATDEMIAFETLPLVSPKTIAVKFWNWPTSARPPGPR